MLRSIFVVSDAFRGFAKNDGVLTLSSFLRDLPSLLPAERGLRVFFGQGISKESMAAAAAQLLAVLPESEIDWPSASRTPVQPELVHKSQPKNVLVTSPSREDASHFRMALAIDERCAEMSDHVTGQHVQGALLIEAARQAVIAVSEIYFYPDSIGQQYYVLQEISLKFAQFCFPIGIEIGVELSRHQVTPSGVQEFDYDVRFCQLDELLCTARVRGSGFRKQTVEKLEARKARQIVTAALVAHDHKPIERREPASLEVLPSAAAAAGGE